MDLRITVALPDNALEIMELRNRAARHLTETFGRGHWSSEASERGVMRGLESSTVLIALDDSDTIVATLTLQKKKPWAIDASYFRKSARPLYLLDMAVLPEMQRRGIGRDLIAAADRESRERGADAIRLDAYDSEAGAGGFYARCGYNEVGRVTYRGVPLIYFERLLTTE